MKQIIIIIELLLIFYMIYCSIIQIIYLAKKNFAVLREDFIHAKTMFQKKHDESKNSNDKRRKKVRIEGLFKTITEQLHIFNSKEYNYRLKKLFSLLLFVVFISLFFIKPDDEPLIFIPFLNSKQSLIIDGVYSVLVILSFVYLLVSFVNHIAKEKDILSRTTFILMCIAIGLLLYLSSIQVVIEASMSNRLSFNLLLSLLLFVVPITILIIKALLTSGKAEWIKILFGIVAILILNGFILTMFGLYNLSYLRLIDTQLNNKSALETIIRVINYGGLYVFDYPTPSLKESIIPSVQFFIWNFYNVYVLGFFIAYFYSLIEGITKKS